MLDTETSGLTPGPDRIIELAAIKFTSQGEIVDSFKQLINPEIPIPSQASYINGITDDMVKNAPIIRDVLPRFNEWIGDRYIDNDNIKKEIFALAHNAKFDISFLSMEYQTIMKPIFPHNVLCTYEMAKACFPNLRGWGA